MRSRFSILVGLALFVLPVIGLADEGFESPATIFSYNALGVPFVVNDSSEANSGVYSLKVGPSSCSSGCLESFRLDLVHTFDTEVYLFGVGFSVLETSSTGFGYGGKIRVGHDGVWNLFDSGNDRWGILGNGEPVTGEWLQEYVSINEYASDARIRLWDITNVSTLWLDDVVLYYIVDGVVSAQAFSWGDIKSKYLK